jgi:hypothetical protein
VTLDVSSSSISSAGGAGVVRIQTNRECAWAIPPQPSWVKLSRPASMQGPAEIPFVVDENRSTSLRSWEVVVADQRVVISQEAASCTWSLSPSKLSIDASGGEAQAVLTTEEYCSWELPSPVSWIAIVPRRGQGTAEITLHVSRNTGGARSGSVRVSSAAIEVAQREASPTPAPVPPAPVPPNPAPAPAPPAPAPEPPLPSPTPPACTFALTPEVFTTPAAGGSISVSLNSRDGCAWTVKDKPSWVTVSAASGTGSAVLSITAAPNTGAARAAVFIIAGRELRIEQAQAPCAYSVTPDRFTLSYKKQERKIQVATQSYCRWSATSSASWVRVSSETRTGSRELEVKIEENDRSGTRTAIITIGGQNFTKDVTIAQNDEEE